MLIFIVQFLEEFSVLSYLLSLPLGLIFGYGYHWNRSGLLYLLLVKSLLLALKILRSATRGKRKSENRFDCCRCPHCSCSVGQSGSCWHCCSTNHPAVIKCLSQASDYNTIFDRCQDLSKIYFYLFLQKIQ